MPPKIGIFPGMLLGVITHFYCASNIVSGMVAQLFVVFPGSFCPISVIAPGLK